MKHIIESIIGKRGSQSNIKKVISNRDIVKTKLNDYFVVIKDPDTWAMTKCRANWDPEGMLYSVTPGGVPDKHNFMYLRDFNEDLERLTYGKYRDPGFDIVEVWKWKPKYPQDAYITFYMSLLEKTAKGKSEMSKDYTKIFDRK